MATQRLTRAGMDRGVSRSTVAICLAIVMTAAGLNTARAQDGATGAPLSVAFVATASNYPDALAVGPVAGRLGAPLLLTAPHALSQAAADGLEAAAPELVIIAGGTGAVSQAVQDQIAQLLPAATVKRAAGTNRTDTARLVAAMIDEYAPAWLAAGGTAADSQLLDGIDSSGFLAADGKAADADTLDGLDASAFALRARPVDTWTFRQADIAFGITPGASELLGQVVVTLPDRCGDGTTGGSLLVSMAGTVTGDASVEAADPAKFATGMFLAQRVGAGALVGPLITIPGHAANSADRRLVQRSSSSVLFDDLAPGEHELQLFAFNQNDSDFALDVADGQMLIFDLGADCP